MALISHEWAVSVSRPPEGTTTFYLRCRRGDSLRKAGAPNDGPPSTITFSHPADPAAIIAACDRFRASFEGRLWVDAVVTGATSSYVPAAELPSESVAVAKLDATGSGVERMIVPLLDTVVKLASQGQATINRLSDLADSLGDDVIASHRTIADLRVELERAKTSKPDEEGGAKKLLGNTMEKVMDRMLDPTAAVTPGGSGKPAKIDFAKMEAYADGLSDEAFAELAEGFERTMHKVLAKRAAKSGGAS